MRRRDAACAGIALVLSLTLVGGLLRANADAWRGDGSRGVITATLLSESSRQDWSLKASLSLSQDSAADQVMRPGPEPVFIADNKTPVITDQSDTISDDGDARMPVAQHAGYLRTDQLDERPLLLQDIDPLLDSAALDVSADESPLSSRSPLPARPSILPQPGEPIAARGILLINEHGGVDRLLLESGNLPDEMERLLMQRFAHARFLPGKLEGRVVRSALRIALSIR